MKRLDEIEARTRAATEGPWEVEFYWDDTAGYEVEAITAGGTKGVIAPPWNSQGDVGIEVTTADAEFIAHARQDVPALVAALRAVLEMHKPDYTYPECPKCTECSDLASTEDRKFAVLWPCPTVEAIRQHLGEDA